MPVRRLATTALVGALLATAACGGGVDFGATDAVDLRQIVTILPTPQGLAFESSTVQDADAAAVQAAFAEEADEEAAGVLADTGFKDAALRTWTGDDGAQLLVVASRWSNHQQATNWGAGAAEFLLRQPDTEAWTPTEVPGARGARSKRPGTGARALSLAIGTVDVFVRARGPVADDDVVRTLQRAIRPVEAAADGDVTDG